MIFEPGKTYRTRDGREARVYATDGDSDNPVHGAIRNECGWIVMSWRADGWWSDDHLARPIDLMPPHTPISDEASWRAGAEAMRGQIAAWGTCDAYYSSPLAWSAFFREFPLPTPPAAPAPEPERLSGECWVNVYEGGAVECYRQRSYADNFQSSCGNPRIACIRIDLSQHRKGEGLPP